MSEKPEDIIRKLIERSASQEMKCMLCGLPADCRGLWIPTKEFSNKLGAMPDKTRVIVYPVCSRHEMTQENLNKIDKELLNNASSMELPNYSN